jgi:hypothetical protein
MNIFSTKSIGLYALAIGGAIVFFNLVTSYGEANIKAPISVAGSYLIAAPDLPDCLQNKSLLFNIQQSGVYLNANLNILDGKNTDILKIQQRSPATSSNNLRPTFSGRLREQKLELSGTLPNSTCPNPSQLRISGSIAKDTPSNRGQLQGQLWLTQRDRPEAAPVKFTATIQPSIPSSDKKLTQSH